MASVQPDGIVIGNLVNHSHPDTDITGSSSGPFVRKIGDTATGAIVLQGNQDTKANILASAKTSGKIMVSTDTEEILWSDGTNWYIAALPLVKDLGGQDMGFTQNSSRSGYYINPTVITDATIENSAIGQGTGSSATGQIRVSSNALQIYLNGVWNTVVTGFRFREDATFGYALEHQPIGFTTWIELTSGDSLEALDFYGTPLVQNYMSDMGAFQTKLQLQGGTF